MSRPAPTFDLTGAYALQRGFVWGFSFRRSCRRQFFEARIARAAEIAVRRTPVDLTGLSVRLEIFDARAGGRAVPLVSVPGTHPLGADGRVSFKLTGNETRAVSTSAARYRIIFTDGEGSETVFLRGRLAVLEEHR